MATWVGTVASGDDDALYTSDNSGASWTGPNTTGSYIALYSTTSGHWRRGSILFRGAPFTDDDVIVSATLRATSPPGYATGGAIIAWLNNGGTHDVNTGGPEHSASWDGSSVEWDVTDRLRDRVNSVTWDGNLRVTLERRLTSQRRIQTYESGSPMQLVVEWQQAGPPVAGFTYTVNEGTVSFTDTSTQRLEPITSWEWDFGDGTTSTVQNPVHTYKQQGDYTVTLKVTAADELTGSTTALVLVPPWKLEALIVGTVTGRTVDFSSVVTTPHPPVTTWQWTMGDGSTYVGPDVQHTYQAGGTYQVTLAVTDAANNTVTATRDVSTREVTDWEHVDPAVIAELMSARVRTTAAAVDIINPADEVIATLGGPEAATHRGVVTGTVSVDGNRDVRHTATLTISDQQLVPDLPTDLFHPLAHNRLRVWWLLRASDGTWIRYCRATVYPTKPATVDDGLVRLTVQGEDVAARVAAARWHEVPDFTGLTATRAIQAIWADRVPHAPVRIVHSDAPVPDDYDPGEPGGNPNDDVTRLCEAIGYVWYADRYGTLVAEPKPDPGVVRFAWVEGDGCQVTELGRELTMEDTANVVTVVSTSNEVDPPISVTVSNTDQDSPLSTERGWEFVAGPVESGEITTSEQARELAETKLAEFSALTELVDAVHRADPTLEPGMSGTIQREASKINGTYQVASFSIALGPSSGQRTDLHPRMVK